MAGLNIGVIGCGAATKRYYAPALKRFISLIDELYLIDKNIALADSMVKTIGIGKALNDYRKIVDHVQGVIIVLPNHLHFTVSKEFLLAGVHVLCEKPLAEKANEVIELNKIVESQKAELCVNNTIRMFPSVRKVKDIITNKHIGDIESVIFREGNAFAWPSETGFYVDPRSTSKGVLFDIGSHILDLICWWLDAKLQIEDYQDDSFGGPESVVRVNARTKDSRVEVFLNRLQDLDNNFIVTGSNGSIEGSLFDWNHLNIKYSTGKASKKNIKSKTKTYPEFFVQIVDNFIKVIQNKEKPLVSSKDVQRSIEFIEECYNQRSKINSTLTSKTIPLLNSKSRILITGASGFIGGHIVENLYFSNNCMLRAGIHKWDNAARIGRLPLDISKLDILNENQTNEALQDVTHVIHCAKGTPEVTVRGTKQLLEAAMKRNVKRFIYLSTAEVYGDVSGDIYEDAPLQYTGNAYNKMKIDAEKICWEYRDKGLPVTIFRPAIVYGPFSKSWTTHFARMLLNGTWGIYEKYGEGLCNLIYIDDLVRGILLGLDDKKAIGQAFNIAGPEVISWNEYFKKFNEALDLPKLKVIRTQRAALRTTIIEPLRLVGGFVRNHAMGPLKLIAENSDLAKRMLKKTEDSIKRTPSPDELKMFNRQAVYSCNKVTESLGFKPRFSVNEGLDNTVEWLRDQGFLLN